MKIGRRAYAEMFGPTVGDRVRLADTELFVEVEKDLTVYGEEVKFGGGKVIRDGMGQSQRVAKDCADTVITNALVIDRWGIVKCDLGIKDGRIAKLGKAGNPDIQPGVDIVIGAGTEIIAGEGMIVTAGGVDSHIHFICPQQNNEALMSGVTTMIGVETGGCPHTAIREGASINLEAVDRLAQHFGNLDIVFVESGGDNLAATFSPELSDLTLYVIDVAAGDKIPRKGGPGITRSDLLIIIKIDLAPMVGASLEVMNQDAHRMRGERPFVFTNLKTGHGLDTIIRFVEERGMVRVAEDASATR